MAKTLRLTCVALAIALIPHLAWAQMGVYRPRTKLAIGERYNLELSFGMWNPPPDLTISSTSLNLIGTNIDAVADLGFAKKKLPEFRLVLRPAMKHKFRIGYIPITYTAEAILTRTIAFRGVTYTVGLPVTSTLDWKAYRFGYEYDLIYRDRGFFGVIGEVKYTDVQASVVSPIASASTHQKAPLPAFGAIARGYLAQNVSITGELTGFKLPAGANANTRGRWVDFDLYGTVNFNNNVGAQVGYRSLDVSFEVNDDSGALKLRGPYVRGVVRF